jgi:hypothetical protein
MIIILIINHYYSETPPRSDGNADGVESVNCRLNRKVYLFHCHIKIRI